MLFLQGVQSELLNFETPAVCGVSICRLSAACYGQFVS